MCMFVQCVCVYTCVHTHVCVTSIERYCVILFGFVLRVGVEPRFPSTVVDSLYFQLVFKQPAAEVYTFYVNI